MNPEREQVRGALSLSEDLHGKLHEINQTVGRLTAERDDAIRRAEEAERRSAIDQRQADETSGRAGRTVELETAGRELLNALERLPLRMEDAGMKQMVTPPAIPLYGTHDWEAVEQAKRRLGYLLLQEDDDG